MVEVDKRIIEILQQHEIDRPTEIRNRVGWIDTDKSRIIGYRIEMRQSLQRIERLSRIGKQKTLAEQPGYASSTASKSPPAERYSPKSLNKIARL